MLARLVSHSRLLSLRAAGRRLPVGRWSDRALLTAPVLSSPLRPLSTESASGSEPKPDTTTTEEKPKERPPGTYMIWAMEAIGATMAFLYYLHLHTDLLKPEVKERLNPERYTPFTLIEKESLTPDTVRFRFRVNRPRFDDELEKLVDNIIAQGAWAMDIKDHMVQTYRTYTPVGFFMSNVVDEESGSREGFLEFVVKRYPRGSLSRFLHDTRVGDQVEMRGPMLVWPYYAAKYRHLYMIAGGTGVAPMYQLIDRILNDPEDSDTRISLLYGSQTEPDIIYRGLLDKLAQTHGDRFSVSYLVDRGPATVAQVAVPNMDTVRAFTRGFERGKDVVLMCGPDAMLAAISGAKPIGAGQGPVQGVLRELGFTPADVFKF
ncbi:hypothetical protein GGH13_000940 [Coemansia sp. S155-1]|nr:hypothetical protein GGH13_000940 [Coemansia sp. S155-1]